MNKNKSITHIVDGITIYEEIGKDGYVSFTTDGLKRGGKFHRDFLYMLEQHKSDDDREFEEYLRNKNNSARMKKSSNKVADL
jgi:hypothetical protein